MLYTSESLAANKIAEKLNTPELRQIAYKSYCAHLAQGRAKKTWNLKTPVKLTWNTMESYLKGEYASEFDPIDKEIAISDGMARWEQMAEDAALGKNKDYNIAALQMNLRNRSIAWDRPGQIFEDDMIISAKTATDAVISQIIQLRSLEVAESPPSESP